MKFIFAPDSFKGSLTAIEICSLLSEAALRHFPHAEIQSVPVADGGEGTVDALLLATQGKKAQLNVSGPLGGKVSADYGILGDEQTIVIEMAQASGLPLVPPEKRNPMQTSSLGTGQLIRHALERGYRKILIGIGGSATNDGGMGMLRGLGAVFLDARNQPLPGVGADLERVQTVDFSGLMPQLREAEITVICDVNNPLLGPTGATHIFGPQKGATEETVAALERGMENYAKVLEASLGKDISSFAGAGAAGGMGAALAGVLNATLQSGIDAILDAVDFDEKIKKAALVVTGEGRMDEQSVRFGKVPAGIATRCARAGVPLLVIVGGMEKGAEELFDIAQASIITTIGGVMNLETALSNANELFKSAADRAFRLLKIGFELKV